MEKIYFIISFLIFLFASTFTQQYQNDLPFNHLRKIDEKLRESILLGFDNYTPLISEGYKNYSISFYTYFLLKNWNDTFIDENYFNNFIISSVINNTDKSQNKVQFNCTFVENCLIHDYGYYYYNFIHNFEDYVRFDLVQYICQSVDNIDVGVPRLINFTDDFSLGIPLNNSEKDSVSSSFEVFKNDLLKLKNKTIFDKDIQIIRNSTYINKSPNSFKIRQDIPLDYLDYIENIIHSDEYSDFTDIFSNNIQLLTNSYGNPKKVPCIGYEQKNKTDDKIYYYLESKGSNHLTWTDLNYAIANITTKDKIFILDFKEGENSTILPEKKELKKNSRGLSTGGIVAIVIPACIVLLGVGGLTFFLSRSPIPPPPKLKNNANNTMGVAASSAAVIPK